jgi:Protein of unknown function (DUF3631)
MTLPPQGVCKRLRQLHGMMGSASDHEAQTARAMLLKLLAEHGLTWNDLSQILADAVNGDGARQEATPEAPEINVLDLVLRLIEKHIVITDEERMAVALWVLHTYLFDRYTHTPRLALLSPVNGCGKTTLLRLLELLVRDGTSSANSTPAVIYHELARNPYLTWLIDEADNLDLLRHANGVMRSVLNMGHTCGASVRRMVRGEPQKFNVFAPLAISAIGPLPFPLLRRSIEVHMQRPSNNSKIERFDAAAPEWLVHREVIQRWAASCKLASDPEIPNQLRNRAADNWRVLLAIADELGHGETARSAAISVSSNRIYNEPGIVLLADVQTVFERAGVDRLTSSALVDGLLNLGDGDWNEFRGPKEDRAVHKLTRSELAALLRPFHIKSRTIWPARRSPSDRSSRGYLKSQFEAAWQRYCSPSDTPTQSSKIKHLRKAS